MGNDMVEIGQTAPEFANAMTNGGENISLSDFRGKKVILYFYPKDDTPGCTLEAQEFTAEKAKFEAAGAVVIGVSKDSVAKHDKFIAKHDLKIPLIADETGEICEAYGVWVEKKNYGRTYMGIERSTFLIDENGVISNVWRKVRVKGHVEAVLKAVQEK